jgi:hypothetical protein
LHSAEFAESRSELSLMWRMRAASFHGDNAVTISRRRRRAEFRIAWIGANFSQSLGAL